MVVIFLWSCFSGCENCYLNSSSYYYQHDYSLSTSESLFISLLMREFLTLSISIILWIRAPCSRTTIKIKFDVCFLFFVFFFFFFFFFVFLLFCFFPCLLIVYSKTPLITSPGNT